jgi:hypothetical protein
MWRSIWIVVRYACSCLLLAAQLMSLQQHYRLCCCTVPHTGPAIATSRAAYIVCCVRAAASYLYTLSLTPYHL